MRAEAGEDPRPRLIPLNWDQRHTLSLQLFLEQHARIPFLGDRSLERPLGLDPEERLVGRARPRRPVREPFALNQYDWLRGLTDSNHACEVDGKQGLHDLAVSFAILESSQLG